MKKNFNLNDDHCSCCGRNDFETEDGYTLCCNKTVCSGSYSETWTHSATGKSAKGCCSVGVEAAWMAKYNERMPEGSYSN